MEVFIVFIVVVVVVVVANGVQDVRLHFDPHATSPVAQVQSNFNSFTFDASGWRSFDLSVRKLF